MANKKKLSAAMAAVAAAAALLAGGTFAWQSISQTALNEASDIVNPGGRLHDDFDGTNKDVYVENFAEDDIFARIRLEEFFEVVLNAGTAGERSVPMIGSKEQATDDAGELLETENGNPVYDYTYVPFTEYAAGYSTEAAVVDGESWWTWSTGNEKVFMPTFNKNKDSLKADINGEYLFDEGVITSQDLTQYTEMETWEEGEHKTANAIYDIDSNTADEIAQEELSVLTNPELTDADTYESDHVKLLSEEHTAKMTSTAAVISMEDWLAMVEDYGTYDEEEHGSYWVYDEDGWVYWSAPIHAGEATGLLLDGIELNQVMDDSWYYAINVVGQFCTAGDIGTEEETDDEGELLAPGTGFYADGETVSTSAEELLDWIGAYDGSTAGGGNEDPGEDPGEDLLELFTLEMRGDSSYPITFYDVSSETYYLEGLDDEANNVFDVTAADGVTLDVQITGSGSSYEDGVLTIAGGDLSSFQITAFKGSENYPFRIYPVYDAIVINEGDTPENNVYYIPAGFYTLKAVGFTAGDEIAYTISADAKRSVILSRDGVLGLSMGTFESAESYTVTAADENGGTGTIKIIPVETSPYDGAIFFYYEYTDGQVGRGGMLVSENPRTLDMGQRYLVSIDLVNDCTAKLTWTLTDASGNTISADKVRFESESGESLGVTTETEPGNYKLIFHCMDQLSESDTFILKAVSDQDIYQGTDEETGTIKYTRTYTFPMSMQQ